MGIPVLTYHGVNVIDNTYQGNDHLALASDLLTIRELGFRVIPLSQVVDWHEGELNDEDVSQTVAITFDDGSWFDFPIDRVGRPLAGVVIALVLGSVIGLIVLWPEGDSEVPQILVGSGVDRLDVTVSSVEPTECIGAPDSP